MKNECFLEENAAYFEIFDDEKEGCLIRLEKETGHFQIENPNKKNIGFVKIDDCLLPSHEHRKADFAVFDETCFCIVEIKNVKTSRRKKARANAFEQLEKTLDIFQEKEIDFSNHKLQAITAFTFERSYPIATTRMQSKVKHFFDKFNADLMEGNSKSFK